MKAWRAFWRVHVLNLATPEEPNPYVRDAQIAEWQTEFRATHQCEECGGYCERCRRWSFDP